MRSQALLEDKNHWNFSLTNVAIANVMDISTDLTAFSLWYDMYTIIYRQ